MIDSQIAKLESEIRYLKQLLDENGIPYDYQAYLERTQDPVGEIQSLRGAGIQILTPPRCYERFAIIDQSIVWYGSMSLLSNAKEDDNLMRITSSNIAQELLELTYTKNE